MKPEDLKELPEEIEHYENLTRVEKFLEDMMLRAVARDKLKAHEFIHEVFFVIGDIKRAILDAMIDVAEEQPEQTAKDLAMIQKEATELKIEIARKIRSESE